MGDIRKGLEEAVRIGRETHSETGNGAMGKTDFTFTTIGPSGKPIEGEKTFHLWHDEAEIFRMFLQAQGYDVEFINGKYRIGAQNENNKIAVSGLNLFGYDMGQLNYKLMNGSQDARYIFNAITQGTNNIADAADFLDFTLLRRASDPHTASPETARVIALDPTAGLNTSSGQSAAYGGKEVERVSSRLMKDIEPGAGSIAQHAALFDTVKQLVTQSFGIQMGILTEPYLKDKDGNVLTEIVNGREAPVKNKKYLFDESNFDPQRTAELGDIFMIRDGKFSSVSTSGFSGTWSGTTGEFRFDGGKASSVPSKRPSGYQMESELSEISVNLQDNTTRPDIVQQGNRRGTMMMYLGT